MSLVRAINRFLSHRLLLSVALTETGKAWGFTPRLSTVVALTAALSASLGWISYGNSQAPVLTVSSTGEIIASTRTLDTLRQRISSLEEEKAYHEQKLKYFAQEVGVLQARLERFDMIGERLFSDKIFGKYLENFPELEGAGDSAVPDMSAASAQEIDRLLSSLDQHADGVEQVMNTTLELLAKTQINRLQQPHGWPVVHERTHVTSQFGVRRDPFSRRNAFHAGVDIAGGYGAPIVASADGVVTFVGYRVGYGLMVEVSHAGSFATRYAHLSKTKVKNGQRVRTGDLLATMGSSGRSTGPHLHFEVLIGEHKVDPLPFIVDNRLLAQQLAVTQAPLGALSTR
jgi:murein DD-endopeptidase MepM/ murein hydrolase activator NlpD